MLTKLFKLAFSKDRRRYERFSWSGAGLVKIETVVLRGRVLDISRGGFLFRPTLPPPFLGSPNLMLSVKGSTLPATILRRSQRGLHCRFTATLTVAEMQALKAMLVESAEAELQEVPTPGAGPAPHHTGSAATSDGPKPSKSEVAI
jgi:hypothetical protein